MSHGVNRGNWKRSAPGRATPVAVVLIVGLIGLAFSLNALLRPALAALGVFTFLASWNDYLWPLVAINDLDKSTIPLALTFFSSVQSTRYELIMAAAAMAVVPVLIVFLIFQRHIVKALVLAGMR